jgi:hypothetical protein
MKYSVLSFKIFFDLEEIIFEIFNIFENNITSFELAKVLAYVLLGGGFFFNPRPSGSFVTG